MDRTRLRSILRSFGGRRILVVGDCMLDEYLWGKVTRISPEAPVQVVEQVENTYAAGGASNVAANIVAMDGSASIVAVVGQDAWGERLKAELERQGVRSAGIVADPGRPTTVKTRIMAHSQQVLRVDREDRSPLGSAVADLLVERVREELAEADAILFSDYTKGVLTPDVISRVSQAAVEAGKPVFANPKPATLRYYQGLNYVQLNQSEAEAATALSLQDLSAVDEAGERLTQICEAEAVMITLGGRGLALFQRGRPHHHIPVVSPEVYDACGCGDTTIAAATLARAAGADWVEAAMLANLAGNAKVRKLGVVPVTGKEIEDVAQFLAAGEPGANGANGRAEAGAASHGLQRGRLA